MVFVCICIFVAFIGVAVVSIMADIASVVICLVVVVTIAIIVVTFFLFVIVAFITVMAIIGGCIWGRWGMGRRGAGSMEKVDQLIVQAFQFG